MMTSVSTLSGYLKTCPFAFMTVLLLSNGARVGDEAGQGAGGGGGRAGQVDLALHMAHPAHKFAVGGGHAPLALGQDAHIAAQAGPAGGGGYDAARVDKGLGPAPEDALLIDGHGGGDDD